MILALITRAHPYSTLTISDMVQDRYICNGIVIGTYMHTPYLVV